MSYRVVFALTKLLQLHFEAEAEAGDVNAQLWLGRRYRWGYGGIEADLRLARRY